MLKINKLIIATLLLATPTLVMADGYHKGDVYMVSVTGVTDGNHILSGTLGLTPGKVSANFKGVAYHYSGLMGTISDETSIKYPKSVTKTNGKAAIHYGYVITGTDVTIVANHGVVHVLYNKSHLVRMRTKNVDGMTIKLPDTVSNSDVDNVLIHKGGTANIPVGNGVVIHITRN